MPYSLLLRLLVTGGYDGYAPWTAEVWDPSCGNTTLPDLPDYRFYHSLDYVDGKVQGIIAKGWFLNLVLLHDR